LSTPISAPAFRIWIYQQPAIVLGCAQRSLRPAIENKAAGTIDIVDRDSGGGAVLTGPWLVGVSVVLPNCHPLLGQTLGDSYRGLSQLHVSALENFGVSARAWLPSKLSTLPVPDAPVLDWACFAGLSPWEVISADGRKLVGLAQKRNRHGVLLVGGTLVRRVDWRLLCDAMERRNHLDALARRTISAQEIRGEEIDVTAFSNELAKRLFSWIGSDKKTLLS
jgi:lipoate-protein ligase A